MKASGFSTRNHGRPGKNIGRCLLIDSRGAQIAEFAVALPLLIVFVVGIFDFGLAFGTKQKLANAAREGARVAASQPTTDLSLTPAGGCNAPDSICAIRDVVGNDLVAARVDDCGLGSTPALPPTGPLAWTFSSTGGCAGALTLTIERGYTFSSNLPAPYPSALTVEATRITLTYTYKWRFNSVITLLIPGAIYSGTTRLTTVSIMQNLS